MTLVLNKQSELLNALTTQLLYSFPPTFPPSVYLPLSLPPVSSALPSSSSSAFLLYKLCLATIIKKKKLGLSGEDHRP